MRLSKGFLRHSFIAYLCLLCSAAYAVTEHTGLWAGFALVGPAKFAPGFKYYVDSELDLIDSPYKFDEFYSSAGLGKQLNDHWIVFVVNRFSISKSKSTGHISYTYLLWQDATWHTKIKNGTDVSIRNRLEERWRFSESEINLRLRERVMLRMPLNWWPKHTFVVSNESYLNLNRPVWVRNAFYEQNQLFIGIGTQLTKSVEMDIGYLNKYQFGSNRVMTNILSITMNIIGKSDYYKE